MSQYPHPYGYGQYHEQQAPLPFGHQNLTGYPMPGHPDVLNPSISQIHRDLSQAAFNSNAAHIPGLGMGGTTPGVSHYDHLPGAPVWTQPPGFSAFASNIPPAHLSETASFSGRQPNASRPVFEPATSVVNLAAKPASQPTVAPTARPTAVDSEIEEGELSEGQFEDLYEPREYAPGASARPVSRPSPKAGPSQSTSVVDTPDGGFYGTDEDDAEKEAGGKEGRARSASYSPFLSPRELQSEIPTPQPVSDKRGHRESARGTLRPAKDITESFSSRAQPADGRANDNASQLSMPTSQELKTPSSLLNSVQEAKKEAQKAILRLWPLGVKYQNYIDEGFDESLMKGLFRDLHLDIPKDGSDSSSKPPTVAQTLANGSTVTTNSRQASDAQSQQSTHPPASAVSKQPSLGEERKDRIARLLAAKAAKAPAVPQPPTAASSDPNNTTIPPQAQGTAPTTATAAPTAPRAPKAKSWGEKERLLQQKIAALQKSREMQSQKAATDTAGSGGAQTSSPGDSVIANATSAGPLATSVSSGSTGAELSPAAAAVQPSTSLPSTLLSGINLSSSLPPKPANQRKRPVATDFVEYSSEAAPPKRPFGQVRKETSLIIDVSEESDDEEMDMDMDVESLIDEPSTNQLGGTSGQRGPGFRDFPPLTDISNKRQFASPAPSVTPPGGPVNKKRETALDLKEKAIQEMRRKIALAEAKRKAKQALGGSETPKQEGLAGDSRENEIARDAQNERAGSMSSLDRLDASSPQLTPEPSSIAFERPPEGTRLGPLRRADRRGRIMSMEIPRVESSLKEKLDRLQQLQDEQARLKAEIERSFAEQKLLAEELQQLDVTPGESPQQNGTAPASDTAAEDLDTRLQRSTTGGAEQRDAHIHSQSELSPSSASEPESSREPGEMSTDDAESSRERDGRHSLLSSGQGAAVVIASAVSDEAETGLDASANNPADLVTELNPVPPGAQSQSENGSAASPSSDAPVINSNAAPDSFSPLEPIMGDETTPMELGSRSASPAAAEAGSGEDASDETEGAARQRSVSLPDQISSVAQPREAEQEIETPAAGEGHANSAAKSASTLTPYESPLRYFHAYRFHPEYQRVVAGGLKSLTYSNRIDSDKELCPHELNGEQCPDNCEFQHFGAISPPDDQILVELGNADDLSGEVKSRFIQGLRELLQKFRAKKVKDFDTIARGIIEFRSQVLGDKSKVLRLEGVTI